MRSFINKLVICVAVAALPAAASANDPAKGATRTSAAAVGASTSAVAKKEQSKVCKRIARSETRMTERVCYTAAQWKKMEEDY